MTQNNICAIYARYSSSNQREASIEDQLRICKDFASSKDLTITDDYIYIDEARSGKSSGNRDQFRAMLATALSKKPPFQRILVEHTSRIARNPREALDVFSLLTFYGVHVSYVSQGIDTASATAEEMITINGLIDSLYLRNLAFETRRGMIGQVMKGFSGGGKRYGYYSEPVYDGKVDIYGHPSAEGYILKINPVEADVVRRIFKMYGEEGLSARKIVTILNKELKETGHPKPLKGSFWNFVSILGSRRSYSGILNNDLYAGLYVWNKTSTRRAPETGARRCIRKDASEWVVVHKPELSIITSELWQKVKQRQREISNVTSGKYIKGQVSYSRNLLTGIIKCGECGGNIVIVSGGKQRAKYGCSNNWNKGDAVCASTIKIDRDELESAICHMLPQELSEETSIDYLLNRVNGLLRKRMEIHGENRYLNETLSFLKKIDREISNYVRAISAGFQSETVKRSLEEAENKRFLLTTKAQSLSVINDKSKVLSQKEITNYLANMRALLRTTPMIGRRIIERYFQTCVVNKQSLQIRTINGQNYFMRI